VIGDERAADEDSFEGGVLDCPHYTRPEEFEGEKVPEVLLSGNHQKIAAWRKEAALRKTQAVRPDLFKRFMLGDSNE
jgi:tRNA (guanine37-N1)-methyltransferase